VQSTSKNKAAGGKRKEKAQPPPVRLEEMLAETAFPDEMLDGSDKYDCPKCNKKVDARRSIRLARPPSYLHITVERYHYDLQKGERIKLNNPVSFPSTLRLRLCGRFNADVAMAGADDQCEAAADDLVDYECVGYLEHVSDSAHSGHYTATLFQQDADATEALGLAAGSAAAAGATGAPMAAAAGVAQEEAEGQSDGQASKRPRLSNEAVGAASSGLPGASPIEPTRRGLWWSLDDLTVSPVRWQLGKTDAFVANPQVLPEASAEAGCASSKQAVVGGKVGGPSSGTLLPPGRIESSAVYLVLYRQRTVHQEKGASECATDRRSCCRLPPHLASWVDADNQALCEERRNFQARSLSVQRFLSERRTVARRLVDELRAEASASTGSTTQPELAVVPAAWLSNFLHGEDRTVSDLLAGESRPAPVTYWRTLLRRPGCPSPLMRGGASGQSCARSAGSHQLDPLAVWCGEVKLIPMSVLDSLGGAGGLDSSMFISLSEAMGREVCEAAWRLHKLYQKEWLQIRKTLSEGKVTVAQARQLQTEGRGDEVVWVSLQVQRLWHKILGGAPSSSIAKAQQQEVPWQYLAFRAFLREVQEARWGGRTGVGSTQHLSEEPPAAQETEDGTGGDRTPAASPQHGPDERPKASNAIAATALSHDRCEVNLTAGILCQHGLVAKTRSAFLARRTDICELLEISKEKGKAFMDLWPHVRAVPCIRAGVASRRCWGDGLHGFGATCGACRGDGAMAASEAQSGMGGGSFRRLMVRRRYASKVIRRVGQVDLPDAEEALSFQCLRDLVKDQLKFPVSRIFLDIDSAEEIELRGTATLETWEEVSGVTIKTIIVEKDESTPPAKEAAAFQGSIFRSASASSLQ